MRILIVGAGGMIGAALVARLQRTGHDLLLGVRDTDDARRRWPQWPAIAIDYLHPEPERWRRALASVDVVVNAVGIFREQGNQRFDALHVKGPAALFEAAAAAGVAHLVQISALGAAPDAASGYLASKGRADAALQALDRRASIVQPSFVYSPAGASTRWFAMLAALPVTALPGGGHQRIQPIHIDDVCEAIAALIERAPTELLPTQLSSSELSPSELSSTEPAPTEPAPSERELAPTRAAPAEPTAAPTRIALVGPRPLTVREYLTAFKRALGFAPRFVALPAVVLRLAAPWLALRRDSMVTPESLRMLEAGNTADPGPVTALLGRAPRDAADFIGAGDRAGLRREAQLAWLLPLLRWAVAAMWIVTGLVSAWVFPVEDSLALLARTGIEGPLARLALYAAALLDIGLGVAMLALRRRRWIYRAQLLLIAAYTATISLFLPEYWAHPYGPILKNLPVLAAIAVLHELDDAHGPADR